jgi:bla regulator protein BlaR1
MIPAELGSFLNHLWQSTAFAALIALLTLALRKNRAQIRYRLWLLASIKFLIPFSLLVAAGRHLGRSVAPAVASFPQIFIEQIGQPFTASSQPPPPATPNLIPFILLGIWLIGFVSLIFIWSLRYHRIRSQVLWGQPFQAAAALPGGVVKVLLSPAPIEPGVFGIFRPILLLPEGIADHLTQAQLEAVLAHELCHIRRRDNLAAALHMAVEALFWFHPVVWWIGARLVEERERACDEEVLQLGNDAATYAESILKTCQFCLETPLPCIPGVTGADLKQRIVRIMSNNATHKLDTPRKLLLISFAIAAVATPLAYGIVNAPPKLAQSQTDATAPLSFEVASVRPNKSGTNSSWWRDRPATVTTTNVSLKALIRTAYDVRAYQISGPDWLNSARYDIAAKAPGPATKDQIRQMLRTLLADRFGLTLHREEKVFPVYELVAAKNGPKLQAVQNDGYNSMNSRKGTINGEKVSMARLAESLSGVVDRPVLDKTGLAGVFNFTLQWSPDDTDGPSIYTALNEQLGLKLISRKDPIEILVIDRVNRTPTEN